MERMKNTGTQNRRIRKRKINDGIEGTQEWISQINDYIKIQKGSICEEQE